MQAAFTMMSTYMCADMSVLLAATGLLTYSLRHSRGQAREIPPSGESLSRMSMNGSKLSIFDIFLFDK